MVAGVIGQGGTITLDAFYVDASNAAVDPVDPKVSILDPSTAVVVSLANPTNVGIGHFQYVYPVAADAMLGAWAAQWFGLINGVQVGPVTDGFTVLEAGSIVTRNPTTSVCQAWATHEDASGEAAAYGADPDEVDDAMRMASDILWNLTGRRWPGVCGDYVRPQAQWKAWDGPPRWWPSVLVAGASSPWGFCTCHPGRETGCARIPEIKLPGSPVNPDTITIKLDGDDFTEFRLDDRRYLVRTDGDGWPCCQDMLLDDTEPNTWSITYQFGELPPIGGRLSAASLGSQLYSAFHGADDCRLPQRITHITRAGTSIAILDPLTLFDSGKTGLPEVDQWVASVRLGDARRRGTVAVPGKWRSVRRTNH